MKINWAQHTLKVVKHSIKVGKQSINYLLCVVMK